MYIQSSINNIQHKKSHFSRTTMKNIVFKFWQLHCKFALTILLVTLILESRVNPYANVSASAVFKVKHMFPGSYTNGSSRGILSNQEFEMIKSRDRIRHGRILQSSSSVVYFPLHGSSSDGLYFTEVQFGSPAKTFSVQIDTGSDLTWVSCKPCSSCPQTSGLGIGLSLFDTHGSATSIPVSCTDSTCVNNNEADATCTSDGLCGYTVHYADLSASQGYFLSDMFTFSQLLQNNLVSNSSARVVFGCSFKQSGQLTLPDKAVDGILGFGRSGLSVISQLQYQGLAPKVFSHCLIGEHPGGGMFVLGQIMSQNMEYTPIIESQNHYSVNLQSIAVNGQQLPIDPHVFSITKSSGTIIDCGTSLSYLIEEAYDPLVNSIIAAVSRYAQPFSWKGGVCFSAASSIDEIFPTITLYFEGAVMQLSPHEYLLQQLLSDITPIWCMGWQKSGKEPNGNAKMSILGDLVLKDRVMVYDLENHRIGWAKYNCSSVVTVSPISEEKQLYHSPILNSKGAPRYKQQINLLVGLCFLLIGWLMAMSSSIKTANN